MRRMVATPAPHRQHGFRHRRRRRSRWAARRLAAAPRLDRPVQVQPSGQNARQPDRPVPAEQLKGLADRRTAAATRWLNADEDRSRSGSYRQALVISLRYPVAKRLMIASRAATFAVSGRRRPRQQPTSGRRETDDRRSDRQACTARAGGAAPHDDPAAVRPGGAVPVRPREGRARALPPRPGLRGVRLGPMPVVPPPHRTRPAPVVPAVGRDSSIHERHWPDFRRS